MSEQTNPYPNRHFYKEDAPERPKYHIQHIHEDASYDMSYLFSVIETEKDRMGRPSYQVEFKQGRSQDSKDPMVFYNMSFSLDPGVYDRNPPDEFSRYIAKTVCTSMYENLISGTVPDEDKNAYSDACTALGDHIRTFDKDFNLYETKDQAEQNVQNRPRPNFFQKLIGTLRSDDEKQVVIQDDFGT